MIKNRTSSILELHIEIRNSHIRANTTTGSILHTFVRHSGIVDQQSGKIRLTVSVQTFFDSNFHLKIFVLTSTVGVTLLSTVFSISAMYVDVPMLSAYFYECQILIGTTDSILNAVIVELYPTNVR